MCHIHAPPLAIMLAPSFGALILMPGLHAMNTGTIRTLRVGGAQPDGIRQTMTKIGIEYLMTSSRHLMLLKAALMIQIHNTVILLHQDGIFPTLKESACLLNNIGMLVLLKNRTGPNGEVNGIRFYLLIIPMIHVKIMKNYKSRGNAMDRQMIHIILVCSLTFLLTDFLSTPKAYASEQEQSDKQPEMARLFKILSVRPSSIPVPVEIANEPNLAIRKEYFRTRNIEFEKLDAQYAKARASLVTMGEIVIKPLVEEYFRHKSAKFEKEAVLVLKEIGTSGAQEVLLNMALGQGKFGSPDRWAARNYIEAVKNKADIRKLLVSKSPDILSDALLALKGQPIDEQLLKQLEELLESNDYFVRLNAAMVIGQDPGEKYSEQKVSAIINAIDKAEKWPEAHQQFPGYLSYGTIADHMYFRLIDALGTMKGLDVHLQDVSNETKGKTHWCILIARAQRGDSSVKDKMYEIIRNSNAGLLRSSAVWSLGRIGTLDDLPFLQEVAKTDPLQVPAPQGSLPDPVTRKRPDKIYPVRKQAQQTIQWIEKRNKEKQVSNNPAKQPKE